MNCKVYINNTKGRYAESLVYINRKMNLELLRCTKKHCLSWIACENFNFLSKLSYKL